MFIDIYLTRPARRDKAREQAIKILDLIGGWLSNDDVYILGNSDYTLADILATAFLTRLNMQAAWFDDQISKRPNVARYWEKVKNRPSYKKAGVLLMRPWFLNTFTVSLIFFTIALILNASVFGALSFFVDYRTDWWKVALSGAVGLFLLIIFFFIIKGC